jgi:hypothetical protein
MVRPKADRPRRPLSNDELRGGVAGQKSRQRWTTTLICSSFMAGPRETRAAADILSNLLSTRRAQKE